MNRHGAEDRREAVREHYAAVARTRGAGGCSPECCSPGAGESSRLGYTDEDLASVPGTADMGLGCGTPLAFAALREGETVVDLGSGGGLDCFLAASRVGEQGRVIGIDMTAEMVARARDAAARAGAGNVEFRLGEIEHLPVADGTADVVVSNCVINLSADKAAVFREAFRVLRPGGRLAISDVVASGEIPERLREEAGALSACIAGAHAVDALRGMLSEAGFEEIRIELHPGSAVFIRDWLPGSGAEQYITSASIRAVRPAALVRR